MASESGNSKLVMFLLLGIALAFFAAMGGGVVIYTVMTHRDDLVGYISKAMSLEKKSPYTVKAGLPNDMRVIAEQATNYYAKGKLDKAASCYQQIIDKYPDSLYALSNLGVVRFKQNKFDEARTALQKAVEISPDDVFSCSNLGITYYQLSEYDLAIGMLEKAVQLDEKDAKSHNYLGCCYSQKGQQSRAESEFNRAIQLDPKFGDAYFNIALVYATIKPPDIEQAKVYYQQARDLGVAKDPRLEKLIYTVDDEK